MLSAYVWWFKDDESIRVLHSIGVALCIKLRYGDHIYRAIIMRMTLEMCKIIKDVSVEFMHDVKWYMLYMS